MLLLCPRFPKAAYISCSVCTDAMSTDLDLSSLPAGTYIVRIHTNNGYATKRLVKK